ncbi:GNAT family N-acetyltransferase [Pantanalinema rosaneae CENA516]|uniref:GNAT family N-acetyltransferase n=1 Tax=Pantanalinema rosaneae TaxID=1620701 RepID=UPI003D700288
MTDFAPLLTGCELRPARPSDRRLIRHLLNQFRQEIIPPPTRWQMMQQGMILGLLVAVTGYLMTTIDWTELVSFLMAATIVVGFVILLVLVLSWNEGWSNFWVIEHDGSPIACAKLRQQPHYSVLYDVYVLAKWRKQGVGSFLVSQLGQRATKPLYLACMPPLVKFYSRLGFAPVPLKSLPPLLLYDLGIPGRFAIVPMRLM